MSQLNVNILKNRVGNAGPTIDGNTVISGILTATSFKLPNGDDVGGGGSGATGVGSFTTIDVSGITTLSDLEVTGVSTFTDITITGNAGIGSLVVSGVSTFVGVVTTSDDLHVAGNLTVSDTNVTGVATISTLGVTGATTTQFLEVTGISTLTGYVGVGSGLVITGVCTATDFDSTSDVKLKTNIVPISDALDKLNQIEGVSFNWKTDNKPALGVIAQEIEKVLPELVHGDDPKTVNYNGIIGLLIEAVKELSDKVEQLESNNV